MNFDNKNTRAKRLIVLQPQFSLTGSARLLASVLGASGFGRTEGWEREIWAELPGALDSDPAPSDSWHWLKPSWAHERGLLCRIGMRLWWEPVMLPLALRKLREASARADLVLANTVANFPALEALDVEVPLVVFVHELELSIMRLLTPQQAHWLFRRANGFIVPSEAAAVSLVRWHGVDRNKVTVISPWLYARPVEGGEFSLKWERGTRVQNRLAARKQLGLPEGVRLVLGCGYVDWVKGPDLFIDAVSALMGDKDFDDTRFVWVGKNCDPETSKFLQGYARHRGVEDRLSFVAETHQWENWFSAADALALTSRAESFSLVALEAACAGIPVAFFKAADGPAEFLAPPLGWGAAELSGAGMAAALRDALAAKDKAVVRAAAAQLKSRHDETRQVARVWAELAKHARS